LDNHDVLDDVFPSWWIQFFGIWMLRGGGVVWYTMHLLSLDLDPRMILGVHHALAQPSL
jgi:hypothetical protein